mgnify:CR=1 FL=1
MNNTESFVLYESVYKQFEILKKRKPAVATDFIEAIMEYGLYGVVPDEESDVWLYGFEQSITSIQRAKDRYIAAVENGSKGGRPSKNLNKEEVLQKKEELKTWKAVAKFYNISEDTLRKLRNAWKTEEPEKPKNLNDNDNDNDNINVNGNGNVLENSTSNEGSSPASSNDETEQQKKEEEEMKGKLVPFKTPIETKTDYSYLEKEILGDGYIVKEDDWIDNIVSCFYALAQPYQIETLEKRFGYNEKEANYIVRNIL